MLPRSRRHHLWPLVLTSKSKRGRKAIFVASIAPQHSKDGSPNDLGIKPQASVSDIPLIQSVFFLNVDKFATVDLRPSGQPRRNGEAQRRLGWLIHREERPRTDDRHVASNDVEQLGELVEPR